MGERITELECRQCWLEKKAHFDVITEHRFVVEYEESDGMKIAIYECEDCGAMQKCVVGVSKNVKKK